MSLQKTLIYTILVLLFIWFINTEFVGKMALGGALVVMNGFGRVGCS